MKLQYYCLTALFSLVTFFGQAQQLALPQSSPKASISQTIGLTEITVKYSTPGVKGREVWGKLVPYGKLWRTGANEATVITFSDDVLVQGEPLPAGTYSLFTIPETHDNWTIIFNKNPVQWGTYDYKASDDVLRVPVHARSEDFHETLYFAFTNITRKTGELNLYWDKIRIPIQIEVEVDKKVLNNIKLALNNVKENNWTIYAEAVNYLLQNGKEPELALEWINKSISISDNFYNNWLKAQLLAQHKEYAEAVALVKKAIKLGEQEKETFQPYAPDLELALREWRILQN